MKRTVTVILRAQYDDGAGATCYYDYYLVEAKELKSLTKDIWRLTSINVAMPGNAKVITAYSRAAVVGSPPAANTRTITVTPAGKVTFGTHETLGGHYVNVTIPDVEAHNYTSFSIGHNVVGDYPTIASLLNGASLGTESAPEGITHYEADYGVEGDVLSFWVAADPQDITDGQIRLPTFFTVEEDLYCRAYTGASIELFGKVAIWAAQIRNRHLEGAAAQILDYLKRGQTPQTMTMPLVALSVTIGSSA